MEYTTLFIGLGLVCLVGIAWIFRTAAKQDAEDPVIPPAPVVEEKPAEVAPPKAKTANKRKSATKKKGK